MRGRHRYIFTNRKHSLRGIMATVLGSLSIGGLVAAVSMTYRRGYAPPSFGIAGLIAMLYSVTGMALSLSSYMADDTYRLFSALGLALNGVALFLMGLIVFVGGI